MTTTTAAATWPTRAGLDLIARPLEKVSGAFDQLDIRLSLLVVDGNSHRKPTLEELGALARFIELCEMDRDVIESGLDAARKALHVGAGETWEDPRAS